MSLHELLDIQLEPVISDEIPEKKKLTPFDFVNAISFSKDDLFEDDDGSTSFYNSYIVNRALSFSPDMILFANEMNTHPYIPPRNQFDFLSSTIRKKKRYDKWIKAEKESDDISLIKNYYNYNNEKAKQVLSIVTTEHLDYIKSKLNQGGICTKKRK